MSTSDKPYTKIDAKRKKIITQDWLNEFPSFGPETKASWSRRIGPLLISVGYDIRQKFPDFRTDELISCYQIGGSYCNLLNAPKDSTYAALSFKPKSLRLEELSWEEHEKGMYKKAVEELKQAAPIPLEGPVTLSNVLDAYQNRYLTQEKRYLYPHEREDPALIAAWAGRTELAHELAQKHFTQWEESAKKWAEENNYILKINPKEEYAQFLKRLDTEKLRELLEKEVIRHQLTKIPYEELIIDV